MRKTKRGKKIQINIAFAHPYMIWMCFNWLDQIPLYIPRTKSEFKADRKEKAFYNKWKSFCLNHLKDARVENDIMTVLNTLDNAFPVYKKYFHRSGRINEFISYLILIRWVGVMNYYFMYEEAYESQYSGNYSPIRFDQKKAEIENFINELINLYLDLYNSTKNSYHKIRKISNQ